MSTYQGFWSYVHDDDRAEGERIVQLAKDVEGEFELRTGEQITLFLDREDIGWGDDWREKIDQGLASVAFFIPVLTPRYFLSPECRRELQVFARKAEELGVRELVLPLLYVHVPGLDEDEPDDDLMGLVKQFQWEDWRELRLEELGSAQYRKGVARLAERLVEANRRAEKVASKAPEASEVQGGDWAEDDAPGAIDQLAAAEESLPRWNEIVSEITEEVRKIGEAMEDATRQVHQGDAAGKGFRARAKTAQALSARLRSPTNRIHALGNEFATELHNIDAGIRTILEMAPMEVSEHPDRKEEFCRFFEVIRSLSAAVSRGLDGTQGMVNELDPLERMSRDLRPVVRSLRKGLTSMIEARKLTDEWVGLMEATEIDCIDDAHDS